MKDNDDMSVDMGVYHIMYNASMKKIIITSLICMSVILTACSEQPQVETTESETQIIETEAAETAAEINGNRLFEDLQSGKTICFIGDSITAGTATDGIPWYEPLEPFIQGEIMNVSEPGWTSVHLTEISGDIPQADVYVIAIGINDVLYIDQPLGAASAEEFIDNLDILADALCTKSPGATMYFVTPWPFLGFPEETYATRDAFVDAMIAWCDGEERICIDPYDTIMDVLGEVDTEVYMWNDYHPDAPEGVGLYSYAVIQQESCR